MAALGLVYLILTFALCFTVVHLIHLAVIGLNSMKKKREDKPAPPPKKSQPVYYIVEKKKPRKSTYSSPREIEFKD